MAFINNFVQHWWEKVKADSASWGSLLLLICGVGLMVVMVASFSCR